MIIEFSLPVKVRDLFSFMNAFTKPTICINTVYCWFSYLAKARVQQAHGIAKLYYYKGTK